MRSVTLLAAITIAAPLRAQSAEATLDRALAAYAKVRTVRASFVQTLTNALLGTTATSAGEVVQQRPQYLAIRFTDPAGDRIVADGAWVWIYLPSSNPGQVIRTRIGSNGAGVPDVTAQFLAAPRAKYDLADGGPAVVNGRPARVLRLTARDPALPFTAATVWVDEDDGLVRQFEATDPSGLTRRVTITRLATNVPVDRAAFDFTPPPGVRRRC